MCPIFTTLFLIVLLAVLVYSFLVWNFGYWKRRGIKEAKSIAFVGSFPSLFTAKRNVAYDDMDIYNQYKNNENFVGIFQCRTPQLMVLSKECVHKVLVNDFKSFHDNEIAKIINKESNSILSNNPFALTGNEWKERRAEITPGLTASRISAVYPVTKKVCSQLINYIKHETKLAGNKGLDAKELALRYTTDVTSDCVLGIQANSLKDKNSSTIYNMTKKLFESSFTFMIYVALTNLIPQLSRFYSVSFFSKEAEAFFNKLMQSSVDVRRQMNVNSERADFLNYMLHLQDKKHLTTKELTSHTMTFLIDGYETTASVLAHTLLLLARYPAVLEKLRREVGTQEYSFDQLNDLPYLEACIHESIRIFPPQLRARKLCTEPYDFINKNGHAVRVEPGTVIVIPAYSIHHDPNIYEDPESFIPERFIDEATGTASGIKKYRDMGAFLGFSDGPRICLGMRFALIQIKAALVEIVRNFDIKVNTKTRKDNRLHDTYFLAFLNGGIWLDFEEIK